MYKINEIFLNSEAMSSAFPKFSDTELIPIPKILCLKFPLKLNFQPKLWIFATFLKFAIFFFFLRLCNVSIFLLNSRFFHSLIFWWLLKWDIPIGLSWFGIISFTLMFDVYPWEIKDLPIYNPIQVQPALSTINFTIYWKLTFIRVWRFLSLFGNLQIP